MIPPSDSSAYTPLSALHKRKVDYDEEVIDDSSVSKTRLFSSICFTC